MVKEIIIYGLLIISTICSIISSFWKSKKTTESGSEDVEGSGKNNVIRNIFDNIPKYIVSAEKLYNSLVGQTGKKTGVEKLAYVLDKIKLDCATAGVEYDEAQATEKINELVAFTKEVN